MATIRGPFAKGRQPTTLSGLGPRCKKPGCQGIYIFDQSGKEVCSSDCGWFPDSLAPKEVPMRRKKVR